MGHGMPPPRMYCKRCLYPLDGLGVNQCPECGYWFHPTRPRTFLRQPRRLRGIPKVSCLGAGLFALFLLAVLLAHLEASNLRPQYNVHSRQTCLSCRIQNLGRIQPASNLLFELTPDQFVPIVPDVSFKRVRMPLGIATPPPWEEI